MDVVLPVKNRENAIFIDFEYTSKLPQWNKFSSVRSRPRRLLEGNPRDYFYPIQRKPICAHPLVQKLGEDKIQFILLQSAYKFMQDIAFVEVQLINNTATKIYNGSLRYVFPTSIRYDLLSIIVDESYHAYVALDFIDQLQRHTEIKMLDTSIEVELLQSIEKFIHLFSENDSREVFEIIAICIGENTLTKELFNIKSSSNINKIFHHVMSDHMIDEGRHSDIFSIILRELWQRIPETFKLKIAEILPEFIIDYLKPDLHIRFDRLLLNAVGLNDTETQQVINETYTEHSSKTLKMKNPIFENIIKVLTRARLFEHQPTKLQFEMAGLL